MTKKDPEQEKQPSEAKDTKESQSKEDEYKEMLQRLQAEFENYKKRQEKELGQQKQAALALFVAKLLPVLDSFELAFKNTGEAGKFRQGMEMVYAQLVDVLEHEGLRRIDAEGKKFDPYRHEVLMKDKSDKSPDIVLEEFQKGYMFKNKVARHSKVKVSE